jgi:hypothetical protein
MSESVALMRGRSFARFGTAEIFLHRLLIAAAVTGNGDR